MTTASVLITVSSNWNSPNLEKCEMERIVGKTPKNISAVAAEELRETPATREQALRIMREWINQNPDIRNVRQDDAFLLRFLRQKKFSIPMAQQTLLKYLNLRKYYPACFSNLNCDDPDLQQIINDGFIAVSPVRHEKGRRVIIVNIGRFNAQKFNCWHMVKTITCILECVMEDPVDQVCGVTYVGDGAGASTAHLTTWNPTDFARMIKWGEQSVALRHKECHIVNAPSAFKYIIDFAMSKITPKMAQRIQVHSDLNKLHEMVDPSCLPDIFGGSIPFQEMITFTHSLLSENKKKLLSLDEMEILSTRGITSKRNNRSHDINSVQGSFRKLEID